MFCTLPFKSSEYAQELKKDIKRAQDAVVAYSTLTGSTASAKVGNCDHRSRKGEGRGT